MSPAFEVNNHDGSADEIKTSFRAVSRVSPRLFCKALDEIIRCDIDSSHEHQEEGRPAYVCFCFSRRKSRLSSGGEALRL